MKSYMNFVKGMCSGIVTGMAIAVTVKCICTKNKKFARRTNRAARAVSEFVGDIQEMLR